MLTIRSNLMAVTAARQLVRSYGKLADSVEHLSSGQRINDASDDAAGLAVRELLRADTAMIRQGIRNVSDAINMLQTAEGALSAVDAILLRMQHLAEQAATGTYSTSQRRIMDDEFKRMAEEIDRITGTLEFNTLHLLDSAHGRLEIQCGGQSIDVRLVDMTAGALGVDSASAWLAVSDGSAAWAALDKVKTAIIRKDSARAYLGTMMNRLESSHSVLEIEAENLLASESRISDVDAATETAKMTRSQVISQAGVSMLSQANAIPKLCLQLLKK